MLDVRRKWLQCFSSRRGKPADDPRVRALIRRTMVTGRVDVLVLVLVVCDMVLKPWS
jgi:hypothetical protein